MMRKPGDIWMEHAAINQFFYVHCARRVDDIFAHLGFVREDRTVVKYYAGPIEGITERQWIKEVCECGGYVRAVHVCFLKAHPGSTRMRYQADGWRPRKRK
jgi:hypothetical protein